MQPKEKGLNADEMVVLNHHGKNPLICQEISHHWGWTSATVASPGDGTSVWALFQMQIKLLVVGRNDVHVAYLENHLTECLLVEVGSNPKFFAYISRDSIISRLGLEPDEAPQEEQNTIEEIHENLPVGDAEMVPIEAPENHEGEGEPDGIDVDAELFNDTKKKRRKKATMNETAQNQAHMLAANINQ